MYLLYCNYRGKAEHKEYNVAREKDMTRFSLALIRVRSKELKQRLREHPRVKNVIDEETDLARLGLGFGFDSDEDIKD